MDPFAVKQAGLLGVLPKLFTKATATGGRAFSPLRTMATGLGGIAATGGIKQMAGQYEGDQIPAWHRQRMSGVGSGESNWNRIGGGLRTIMQSPAQSLNALMPWNWGEAPDVMPHGQPPVASSSFDPNTRQTHVVYGPQQVLQSPQLQELQQRFQQRLHDAKLNEQYADKRLKNEYDTRVMEETADLMPQRLGAEAARVQLLKKLEDARRQLPEAARGAVEDPEKIPTWVNPGAIETKMLPIPGTQTSSRKTFPAWDY